MDRQFWGSLIFFFYLFVYDSLKQHFYRHLQCLCFKLAQECFGQFNTFQDIHLIGFQLIRFDIFTSLYWKHKIDEFSQKVTNLTIAAAWKLASDKKSGLETNFPKVYHSTSGDVNPLTCKQAFTVPAVLGKTHPLSKLIYHT